MVHEKRVFQKQDFSIEIFVFYSHNFQPNEFFMQMVNNRGLFFIIKLKIMGKLQ